MVIVIIALFMEMRSPRYEAFRTVDVLLLFFAGAACGAAIVTLVTNLRQRGDSSST